MDASTEIENQNLFQYLDVAASIFMVISSDHSIELINRKGCEVLGYRREEIIGKNWFHSCIPKKKKKELALFFDRVVAGTVEPPDVYENWVLAKGNKRKLIQWRNALLKDENGNVTGLIFSGVDVTEINKARKQLQDHADRLEEKVAERTLELEFTVQRLVETNLDLENQIQVTRSAESKAQRSQSQFAAIAKNFPKGLIVVFNADFELVYVEGEELRRLDVKKEDFEGERIDDISIFSAEQIELIKRDINKTIRGDSLSFEVEFQKNCYAVNSTPLHSDGETIVWSLFVYHNITDQRKAQEKISVALKVEQEMNELKSRFISMASHEFRTPLSAILSSAILIGKQNGPGKEERRMKHVDRIRTNVKNLVVILNDFLSLSKLEEGKVRAEPQHFELVQFTKLLVKEMKSVKKDGQSIRFTHTQAAICVFLDSKLMSHILINLVSNALKYSDEGAEIILELKVSDEGVIFNVVDKGIGIPQMEQKSLFERFFRAGNVTNIQGTGLGLHIVKQYSELMGGIVGFKSKVGKGSTFTLKLPLNLKEHEKNTVDRG